MKKMIVLWMLFFTAGVVTNHADAQPRHAKAWGKHAKLPKRGGYYYYPSANVYYSQVSHRYWYPRNGVWINASVLPPSIVVYNKPGYVVYRDIDDDIWRDNRIHYRRYHKPVYMKRYRPGVSVRVSARF